MENAKTTPQTKLRSILSFSCVFVLVWSVVIQTQSTVFALSEAQRKVINSGVYYFNTEVSAASCGGDSLLSGSTNEEKSWNYLISKGLTPIQAAGAMGNMQHEGGFNPRIVERGHMVGQTWSNQKPYQFPPDMDTIPPHDLAPIVRDKYAGQPGYGIIQWTTPGRKQGLQSFADTKSQPVNDLATQLDYMWSELEGPYKNAALDPLKQATDLAEAVRIWQDHYEVGSGFGPRFASAQDKLTQFGSGTVSTAAGSGNITCNSGQISGGMSLPVDRRWYDEHPEWFTKPHHDYPSSDIPVPTGTPVYSMTAGTIDSISDLGDACGIGMTIDAGNGIRFIYCHSSDAGTLPARGLGDKVNAGDIIMNSNDTGNSTGPHLHIGVYVDGVKLCPQDLFVGIANGSPPDIKSLRSSGCTY